MGVGRYSNIEINIIQKLKYTYSIQAVGLASITFWALYFQLIVDVPITPLPKCSEM